MMLWMFLADYDYPVHGDFVSLIIVISLRIVITGMLMMTMMKDYTAGFYMTLSVMLLPPSMVISKQEEDGCYYCRCCFEYNSWPLPYGQSFLCCLDDG